MFKCRKNGGNFLCDLLPLLIQEMVMCVGVKGVLHYDLILKCLYLVTAMPEHIWKMHKTQR
jgi:hypothetical protein